MGCKINDLIDFTQNLEKRIQCLKEMLETQEKMIENIKPNIIVNCTVNECVSAAQRKAPGIGQSRKWKRAILSDEMVL